METWLVIHLIFHSGFHHLLTIFHCLPREGQKANNFVMFRLLELSLTLTSHTLPLTSFLPSASRLWDEPCLHADGSGVQPGPPSQWNPVFAPVHSWGHHICPGRQRSPLLPHEPETHPLWGGCTCWHQPDDLLSLRSRPTTDAADNQVLTFWCQYCNFLTLVQNH